MAAQFKTLKSHICGFGALKTLSQTLYLYPESTVEPGNPRRGHDLNARFEGVDVI